MNSVQLIRALPDERVPDLLTALVWLNPLPQSAQEVNDKITTALQISAFSLERSGEGKQSQTANHNTALLQRLKRDVDFILTVNNLNQRG